jgi:hypothetical protein
VDGCLDVQGAFPLALPKLSSYTLAKSFSCNIYKNKGEGILPLLELIPHPASLFPFNDLRIAHFPSPFF